MQHLVRQLFEFQRSSSAELRRAGVPLQFERLRPRVQRWQRTGTILQSVQLLLGRDPARSQPIATATAASVARRRALSRSCVRNRHGAGAHGNDVTVLIFQISGNIAIALHGPWHGNGSSAVAAQVRDATCTVGAPRAHRARRNTESHGRTPNVPYVN